MRQNSKSFRKMQKCSILYISGPPFYVVINSTHLNFDYAEPNNTNKVCGTSKCNENSLQNTINIWSKMANQTRIASPAMSWVDDYVNYLSSTYKCCLFFEKNHSTVYSEEWASHRKSYKSRISTYIGKILATFIHLAILATNTFSYYGYFWLLFKILPI